eukprot:898685-Rhodomonas_salina.1
MCGVGGREVPVGRGCPCHGGCFSIRAGVRERGSERRGQGHEWRPRGRRRDRGRGRARGREED